MDYHFRMEEVLFNYLVYQYLYMLPQNVPGESGFLGAGRRVDPVDGRGVRGQ